MSIQLIGRDPKESLPHQRNYRYARALHHVLHRGKRRGRPEMIEEELKPSTRTLWKRDRCSELPRTESSNRDEERNIVAPYCGNSHEFLHPRRVYSG